MSLTAVTVLAMLSAIQAGQPYGKLAHAEQIIVAASQGRVLAPNSTRIVSAMGITMPAGTLIKYTRDCEIERLESSGSNVSAALLCRVQRLKGVTVGGGARLLAGRELMFVYEGGNKLTRVVLGDRDPLNTTNVLPSSGK